MMEAKAYIWRSSWLCWEYSNRINVVAMEGTSFIQHFYCWKAIMCKHIRHKENNTECADWICKENLLDENMKYITFVRIIVSFYIVHLNFSSLFLSLTFNICESITLP